MSTPCEKPTTPVPPCDSDMVGGVGSNSNAPQTNSTTTNSNFNTISIFFRSSTEILLAGDVVWKKQ